MKSRPRRGVTRLAVALAVLWAATAAPSQTAGGGAAGGEARVFVRVNQIGYRGRDPKLALAFSRAELPPRFGVLDAATRAVVFEGAATKAAGRWAQFDHHAELDFSSLARAGRYVVKFGAGESAPFEIGEGVYAALPDELLEFMREQRCGYNPFVDAVCHAFDGRTAYGPRPAGTYLDARGGWHDAGDQLKYLLTASNATAQMLLAYLLERDARRHAHATAGHGAQARRAARAVAPSIFRDGFDALGRPGADGEADVLGEARWGLDWMLKLHPAPGELYHQVADDRDHRGWRLPQNETADYGWGAGSYRVVYFADGRPQGLRQFKSESGGVANLAGRYAAAMALGYQVWRGDARSAGYAARLLRAGREVYEMGLARPGVQQGNSYGAPYRYEETTWADDMEWGAAELYRATGERRYLADARRFARLAGAESWAGRDETRHYQFYPFLNLGHFRLYDLADRGLKRALAGYYREEIGRTLRAAASNPYGAGVPFIWCSNNLAVALATECLLYERMTGDAAFGAHAARQRDWLLGRNPWGVSMFTGIPEGGQSPRDPHLFANVLLRRAVRGGLVDGPVYARIFRSLRGVAVREADPLAPFQDERAVFHDDARDYSTDEPTMDGTAAAILLWSLAARLNPPPRAAG